MSREDEIVDMNKSQIRRHIGNDGTILENTALTPNGYPYSGVYTSLTQTLSGGKKMAGAPYDFTVTGAFFGGFELDSNLSIFSTGIGSGLKRAFFKGYDNMFGLTVENENKVLEEVKNFVTDKMLNELWK